MNSKTLDECELAAGYIYDFVGGGVPVGPETLAVGPSQTSGDSMRLGDTLARVSIG